MRLGLYGGSFDPIHHGHVRPVLKAVERLQLDRVLYLPTAQPPHKMDAAFAPALHRFAMAELALLDHNRLQVSDFELVGRPSFTVETLEHFNTRFPDAWLHLLIGSDSLAGTPVTGTYHVRVRNHREVCAACTFDYKLTVTVQ